MAHSFSQRLATDKNRLRPQVRFRAAPNGLFFNSGQTSRRQPAIFSSLRWEARSTGFCGVHASSFKIRETWALWYETPNSWRMMAATRAHVHNWPRNPYASAPAAKRLGRRCLSAVVSRRLAPGRGRAKSASSPCVRARVSHWLTAPLVTPRASAMSFCFQPLRFRSRACKRRISFQS